MEIGDWLEEHRLSYIWIEPDVVFELDELRYLVLDDKDIILNEEFNLVAHDYEIDLLEYVDRIAFKFGAKWYWSPKDGDTQLNPLRYIGKSRDCFPELIDTFPFLGVHGKFEILNGSRDYNDWCIKAKFLGYKTLAICEAQTMAGTMLFQEACEKHEIKSIIGQSAYVKSKEGFFYVKLYVKNKTGWRNLLKINKAQLVDNWEKKFIEEDDLVKYGEGLIAVINPDVPLKEWLIKKYKKAFDSLYYQLDFTEWLGDKRDEDWLKAIEMYLSKFIDVLEPVLVNDAYYLDRIDAPTKKALNDIGKVKYQHHSVDQYMKSLEDYTGEFSMYIKNWEDVFARAYQNTRMIAEDCDYKINTSNRYLPKYEMTDEEKEQFEDNNHLFHFKLLQGLENKIIPKIKDDPDYNEKIEVYLKRIEEESAILIKGNVVDYFLILSDVCIWCQNNNVLVGHGRGSAGGALVSLLLDIIQIDPIEWDLLFSRFLTEARLKSSLPDIDLDFSDRDRVVEYIKQRYGRENVASVATYGNMKVKNAIKDFSRLYGIKAETANYITGIISKEYESGYFSKFFELVTKEPKIKDFVKKNPKVFEYFDILLHNTRTASIHACATIISPNVDEDGEPVTIHDLIPTKKMDGQIVTEWEGGQLEKAGFLKEDILGLKQLEKIQAFLELIKEPIDIYSVDLEQEEVFEFFHEGHTEDVFQFGSDGLKAYCKYLKPDTVEELTAANSLYRPGPMESDAHTDFVRIKFGEKKPEFDYLLEDVTKKTYGLYIYQEQIMKAYSIVTGADMDSADKFRKYVTKAYKMKSKGIVDEEYVKYEKEFIENYVKKGQKQQLAQQVWDKLVAFASYGFNRSHSAAYAMISYLSQWFKVNYPIEFWTVSLNECVDDERSKRMTELRAVSDIRISPVDINNSGKKFTFSKKENKIYWSLTSVKWLGEKGVDIIIAEREQNGEYFSIEEFINRVPKKNINKRSVTNLITSGAFDEMYKVKNESERFFILEEYHKLIKQPEESDKYLPNMHNNIYWQILQAQLTGFGNIGFKELADKEKFKDFKHSIEDLKDKTYCTVAGIIEKIDVKNSKKIGDFCILVINCNNTQIDTLIWNDVFELYRDQIVDNENRILIMNGQVRYDAKFSGKNVLNSNRATKLKII